MTAKKKYREMIRFNSFEDRFNYLKLRGGVGVDTFGFDRYLNQNLYRSDEWKKARQQVIVRDNGCDLGIPGMEISGKIYVHHMNPLTKDDIFESSENLFNPEYLVCVSHETHNAIHYGDTSYLERNKPANRTKNDMSPWKLKERK